MLKSSKENKIASLAEDPPLEVQKERKEGTEKDTESGI